MRKTALFIVIVLLLFSLSGCVVFQKVMNVSGNWIVELEDSGVMSELRALAEENDPRVTMLYTTLKLTQAGNQLTGKFYFFSLEISVSGTIGEDNSFEVEGSMPIVSSDRNQNTRAGVNIVLDGTAIGSKTLFNKTATKLEGEMYFDDDPLDTIDFEATK